jgi:glucosamine kinase
MNVRAAVPETRLFVGIDGGGTMCRARIEDSGNRVLGAGVAGPAAVRLGIGRALGAVEHAAQAAARNAGLPREALAEIDAGVGLAGIDRKGVLEQLIVEPHPFRSVAYVNDAMIACIGAHAGRDGGIVIIGTGSIGFALVEGREIRVGGYGFPISDEGSGADLGLRAIRLALQACDGRAATTGLTRQMMTRFGDDPLEVVAWMDQATATEYASFAPLVMRSAQDGDPAARRIVHGAAERVGGLVRRLLECGAPRIGLVGGLASAMKPWLAPDVRCRLAPLKGDAVDGALRLARRAALVR